MDDFKKNASKVRQARKNALIQKGIASLLASLHTEIKDLSRVTVSRVYLTPDMSLLRVYLYSIEGKGFVEDVIHELKLYRRSLKGSLTQHLQLRRSPDIRFYYDDKHEKTTRLESLIDQAEKTERS